MTQSVLTIFGKDRPGIIAEVTGVLYKSRSNLEDISMTILEGEFSMIMIVDMPSRAAALETRRKMESFAAKTGMVVHWKELDHRAAKGEKHARGSTTHILTAAGKDRTGIVHRISSLFAKEGLNITDLNSRILPGKKADMYVVVLEVDVPQSKKLNVLHGKIGRLAKKLGIDIQFKPIDVLRF